jgi:hypothetical protein
MMGVGTLTAPMPPQLVGKGAPNHLQHRPPPFREPTSNGIDCTGAVTMNGRPPADVTSSSPVAATPVAKSAHTIGRNKGRTPLLLLVSGCASFLARQLMLFLACSGPDVPQCAPACSPSGYRLRYESFDVTRVEPAIQPTAASACATELLLVHRFLSP